MIVIAGNLTLSTIPICSSFNVLIKKLAVIVPISPTLGKPTMKTEPFKSFSTIS